MKNLLKFVFILSLSMALFNSCTKKEDSPVEGNKNASYEFKIDGDTVLSNSSIPLGMLTDANGVANQISVTEPDDLFNMLFTNIPITVGSSVALSDDDDILIAVNGTKIENYILIVVDNGTMTRTANDKVSFTGTFEHNGTIHNATGFIKSDGMKNN